MEPKVRARTCAPCLVARVAVAAGVALAAGFLLRRYAVEPEAVARACEAASAPLWCPLRQGLVFAMQFDLIGSAGIAAGMLAFLRRDSGAALPLTALVLGGLGLTLQNPLTGAAALLAGMLCLVRAWGVRPA